MRADLHLLFDAFLLSIDPENNTICLSASLSNTEYADLNNDSEINVIDVVILVNQILGS